MGFFQEIFLSRLACSMPHLMIPRESLNPYAHMRPSMVGVTQPNSESYLYNPSFPSTFNPSGVIYGLMSSIKSRRYSSSSFDRGAPESPSSQQPPLHLFRSQTNCSETTSSLTSILSITINCPV